MSNKHKAYRKVLNVLKQEYKGHKVTQVVWCIVERETSRSIYSTHVGVTTYTDSVKNQGISAYMSRKPERVQKIDLTYQRRESFTESYWNALQGQRTGEVTWYDDRRGQGYVRDDVTGDLIVVYACNVKGADSAYHELVTTVKLNRGDKLAFELRDFHTTQAYGACSVQLIK